MKLYNVKEEELKIYQQAVDRYYLMVKDLGKLQKENKLNAPLQETLNALEELSDIAEELEKGTPVWDMEAKAFVEDVNLHWESLH